MFSRAPGVRENGDGCGQDPVVLTGAALINFDKVMFFSRHLFAVNCSRVWEIRRCEFDAN